MATKKTTERLSVVYVPTKDLEAATYNPRKWNASAEAQLTESIVRYGIVDPLLVNSAPRRKGIVIGGHFRLAVIKKLNITEVPVVYINLPDLEKEKELNIRLNKNTGEFDLELLSQFDEAFLTDIGFDSEDLDLVFDVEDEVGMFDLEKELAKLDIKKITVKKGDVYELNGSRLMCGDSTIEADFLKLMEGTKADMCLTDPPYILDYLHGKKKNGDAVTGFGAKRDRRYLETDSIPDDFTEKWMANIKAAAKDNFHIIVYENWKNIRIIWGEMEKYWKVKNMIVWHLPNRNQGFAGKYRFFSKHDIAMVGSSLSEETLNGKPEEELLQNEYETALYAISGKPQWEGYEKGQKYQPTDFIQHKASDEKSSGQNIIFGTKPLEILIPYIKVLTKRGDLIVEPFGGSGSTLCASVTMNRRCYLMEKSPVYAQVILRRWSKLTGLKPTKIHGN